MNIETITFPRDELADQLSEWIELQSQQNGKARSDAATTQGQHHIELAIRDRFKLPISNTDSAFALYAGYYNNARRYFANDEPMRAIQATGLYAANASVAVPLLRQFTTPLSDTTPPLFERWTAEDMAESRKSAIGLMVAAARLRSRGARNLREIPFGKSAAGEHLRAAHLTISKPGMGMGEITEADCSFLKDTAVRLQGAAILDWVLEINFLNPGRDIIIPAAGQKI